ncbi:MAG: Calx-beta domain-containing protein [Thiolinea sp.]
MYTGTATHGLDYTAPTDFTIADGSEATNVTVKVIDDSFAEGNETVTATISNPSVGVINTAADTANLADDDAAVNYTLAIAKTKNGAEPNTNGQFTVTVTPINNTGANITGTLFYFGTATRDIDYTAPTTFMIPNGSSSTTVDFAVIDDSIVESEALGAQIVGPLSDGVTASGPFASATNALIVDDDKYQASIIKTVDGAEPSTNGQFTVTLSPANTSGRPVTGNVSYGGTATRGIDYNAPPSFSIANGSSTATLDFSVIDDIAIEGNETIIAAISGLSAPSTLETNTRVATANLADNDVAVNYTLAIAKTTDAAEPNTAGQFTVTVSPANATGAAITGTVAYSGTATSGTDYTAPPTSFSIPNGSSTATLDFTVADDTTVEGTETVMATISNPSIGTISTAAATANLADDDVAVNYTLAIAKTTDGAEPNTAGRFTVTVSPANATGAAITGTVAYSGTATNGTDYTAPPASFSIPNGSSTATLDFTVTDDTAVEGTETVMATISNPSIGTISTAAATANLADDDVETNHRVSITQASNGAEPNTAGQFTVTVSPANNTGAAITGTVAYTGTATLGTDYTAPTSFSIPNGESTASIPFTVVNDTEVEGTETIIATITLATPAATLKTASTAEALTLGSHSASAVINDDDSGTAIPIFSPFGLLALLGGLFWLGRRFKN